MMECGEQWRISIQDLIIRKEIRNGICSKVCVGQWHQTDVEIILPGPPEVQEASADHQNGWKVCAAPESLPVPSSQSDGKCSSSDCINQQAVSYLKNEARMLMATRHPNVLLLLGVCCERPCLVMELCSKGTLRDLLAKARSQPSMAANLGWLRRLKMAWEIAKGVLHLHTRNPVIIHGDLRTANILVNSSWHCKVAEFAMARMVGDKAKPICPEAMGIHHLAPEVQLGAETSTQSDVYAFGMMLLELLTLMPCQNTAHLLQSAHGEEVMDIFADVIGGPVYGMLDYLNFTRRCISADPVLRPGFDAIGSQLRKLLYESADVQSAAQLAPESWASASGSLHSMDRVCSRLPGWYDKAASRRTSISPPEPSVLHGYISAFPTPTSVSGCHPMELACMPDGTPVPATPAPAKRGGTTPDLGPPNRWSMPPIPPALYCSPSAGPIPKASSFIRAEAAGCTAQPCTSAAAPCNHVPPPTDLAGSHTSPLRQPPPGKESLGERFALWHFRPLVLHPSHHSLGQAFKPAQGSGKYGADQSQRQHPQARIEAHGLTAPTMPYTNVAAGYADGNQKVAGMQIVPQQCCPAPLWPTDFPRHPQPEVGRHLAALGGQEPKPESPAGPYCGELIFASVPVRSDEPGYAAVPQHMDFCKAVSWPSGCSSDATVLGSNPVSGSKSLQHVNVSCCASVQALHLPCRHSSDARLPLLPSALSSSASGTLPAGWQIPRLPVPGEPCEAFKRG